MEFGQNLMLISKKRKLSQADLGKIIGTSGDVIGRYERGDITPSVYVVAKIADALDVPVRRRLPLSGTSSAYVFQ